MVEKPPLNPKKPQRRRGRPTREEAARRALAELGLDPKLLDPRRVLAEIAADPDAPASARVNAAKALLGQEPAETKQPGKNKPQARLSKKAAAARAAVTAGQGSGWGDDLLLPSAD